MSDCIVCAALRARESREDLSFPLAAKRKWIDWYHRDQPNARACEEHEHELAASILRSEAQGKRCTTCGHGFVEGHRQYGGVPGRDDVCSEYCRDHAPNYSMRMT